MQLEKGSFEELSSEMIEYLKLNDTFDSGRSVVANREETGGRSESIDWLFEENCQ